MDRSLHLRNICQISNKYLSNIYQTSIKPQHIKTSIPHLSSRSTMYPSGIRFTLQRILTGIRCTCTLVNQGVMLIYSKICWWTKSVVGAISIKFLTSVYPISCKHLSNQCPANIYQTSIKSSIRYIHQRIPAGIRCTCALGNRYVMI